MQNRPRLIHSIFLIPLVLLLSCGKKTIELKFSYLAGHKTTYRVVSELNTRTSTNEVTSAHTVKLDALFSYTIDKILDNGDAEISFSYDSINYLNTDSPEKADKIVNSLKNTALKLTISPYGDIDTASGYEGIPQMDMEDFNLITLLFKAHPIFPRQPVEIGRKWDRQQEYPIENGLTSGNMLVYKRFSIMDTLSKDGFPAARIKSEISMKFDVPPNDCFTILQDGQERLGLFGNGVIHFDMDKKEVASTSAAIFGKMIVMLKHPVTGEPMKTRIELAQNITMSRLP